MFSNKTSRIKYLALLPIVLVILVSGCTMPIGPTPTGSGGVVIEAFEPDLQVSEIYSGEPITFQLKFRNTGSVKAENVFAELFGLDEDWCCESVGLPGEGPWRNNEKLPNEEKCRYTSEGFPMLPPDPAAGTSGETFVCSWSYRAPDIPRNLPSVGYRPMARLFYTYHTTSSNSITFGSHQDIRGIQDVGGALPMSTTDTTLSPISITMETKSPIRFWTAGMEQGEVTFPIEINIENVGGGIACATDSQIYQSCKLPVGGENAKNKIKLEIIPDPGLQIQDECSDFTNTGGKIITLWKGQSNSIACDVTATGLENKGPVQKSIAVKATYEYAVDAETSIRVVGRE